MKLCIVIFFNIKIMDNDIKDWTGISLFSGAGGDTLGMEMAGIDVVGFVEKNEVAINTHLANFPNSKLIGKDITKIKDEDFSKYKDKINVIFGGFPCQSFSQAGKKDPNDPRGQLFIHLIRAANLIRPDYIIGENVKGLLKRKTNGGENVADVIMDEFRKIGYNIKAPILLNSKNFGVPQNRERIFFVACKNGFIDYIPPSIKNIPTLRPIIENSLTNAIRIKNNDIIKIVPKEKWIDCFYCEKTGNPPTNLLKCYNKEGKYGISYARRSDPNYSCIIDVDSISNTIICTYGRMPRLFVPMVLNEKKYYLRPYTTKELQQIQGFPENYIFMGTELEQITQIGNAVPPPIVCDIINELRFM